MSEDAATEWLAVAAGEVANMRPTVLKAACAEARKTCTHHGQIIPTILHGKTAQGWRDIGSTPFLPNAASEVARLADRTGGPRQIGHVAASLVTDAPT